jgi:glycosyltransferase involved in cell wall biosynthesis
MPTRIAVIIAASNEAECIASTIASLRLVFPGASVYLADDGSRDATAEIARGAGARVLRSRRRRGKGAAATSGARAALEQAGRDGRTVFVLCDADLGESAARLAALAEAVGRGEADVAVASFARRIGGGFGLAAGFARWAIRRRTGNTMSTPLSGQRALGARALRDVLPFAAGYGMELGMTLDAIRAGHRVREIELDLSHRATARTPAGFAHRGRQLLDAARAYLARR